MAVSGLNNNLLGSFQMMGAATGFDANSVISKLMDIEMKPYNKKQTEYDNLKWKQKSWDEINTKLKTFYSYVNDFKLQSNLIPKKVTLSTESYLSASATADANNMGFYVNIDRVATNSYINGNTALTTSTTLAAAGITSGTSIQITVDGSAETIYIDDSGLKDLKTTDTMQTLINKISQKTDANLFISGTQAFLTNKTTGDQDIRIDANSTFLNNLFGVNDTFVDNTKVANYVAGVQAQYDISFDGSTTTIANLTSDSNSVTWNNVTMNFKSKSYTTTEVWTKLTVEQNVDTSVTKIKEFVDKYNELMNYLNTKYSESKVTDVDPTEMTDLQKMKGLLKGDNNLETVISKLRSIAYGSINPTHTSLSYEALSQIGITSGDSGGTYQNSMKGLLSVNETDLRTALQSNAYDVWNLFALNDTTNKEYGVANLFKNYAWDTTKFKGYIYNISGATGTIGTKMSLLAREMTSMLGKLQSKEFYYVQKFSAMEQAVSKMNMQGSYLTQSLNK